LCFSVAGCYLVVLFMGSFGCLVRLLGVLLVGCFGLLSNDP
jgi:hypothetical protein